MTNIHRYKFFNLQSEPSVYNKERKFGYLVRYFTPIKKSITDPYMTYDDYRHRTYAPNILDYKEGKVEHIEYFISNMIKFISKVLEIHNESGAILIPVPSSKSKKDPEYNDKPRPPNTKKNRDNRNEVFLQRICEISNKLKYSESIVRIKSKKEKEIIEVGEMMKQLKIINPTSLNNKVVILIDDVVTTGTTFEACKNLIEENSKPKEIIAIAIGQTRQHSEF